MRDHEHRFFKKAAGNSIPDKETVKKRVLDQVHAEKKAKRVRWLMPIAASILVAIIICASIPTVRAGISQWFSSLWSVSDYLAQPSEDRPDMPELNQLIDLTKPDSTTAWDAQMVNVAPEWQVWLERVNPTLGEMLFDGEKLIVIVDLGGYQFGLDADTELNFLFPDYIILNGQKYAYSVSCQDVYTTSKFAITIDFTSSINLTEGFDDWTDSQKQSFLDNVEEVQQYDPDYTPFEFLMPDQDAVLDGIQQVGINLPIVITDLTSLSEEENGISYEGEVAALMKLQFSFNPQVRNGLSQTYEINKTIELSGEGRYMFCDRVSQPGYQICYNKTIDMTGVTITVDRLEVKPISAELYIYVSCPDDWDSLDKECFLESLSLIKRLDGVGMPTNSSPIKDANGEQIGRCYVFNIFPSEIKNVQTFEIIPRLWHYVDYDEVPYIEGQPTLREIDGMGGHIGDVVFYDYTIEFSLKEAD